jgi:hypothetical protein
MDRAIDARIPARTRAEICARLQARRPEIEEVIGIRLLAISDPGDRQDPEYLRVLRAAMAAAIDHGLEVTERGAERSGPVPAAILVQARHAARNRVGLDTVLRRYFAGYTAMADYLMQETRDLGHAVQDTLHNVQRELATLFDQIVAAVSIEYEREAARTQHPPEERLAHKVRRLLAGELIDATDVGHEFDAWHIGLVSIGSELPAAFLQDAATALDVRLLQVKGGELGTWAWLSARRRLGAESLDALSRLSRSSGVSLALGEPGYGLRGWRLTHRQAVAALVIAIDSPRPLTRYAEVAVVAALARDDDLLRFLAQIYLQPLDVERERGEVLRSTLDAYFSTGRNVSSAAAALGIARQTVTSRLRAIEDSLGLPLDACATELELAVRLDKLGLIPSFDNDRLM